MYNYIQLDDIKVLLQVCFQSIHLEAFIESTVSPSADTNHTKHALTYYFTYSSFSAVPFFEFWI